MKNRNTADIINPLPVSSIKEAWARFYCIDIKEAENKTRKRPLILYKHVLRYFLYEKSVLTLKEIINTTGSTHHATAYHSHTSVKGWLEVRDEFALKSIEGINNFLTTKTTAQC